MSGWRQKIKVLAVVGVAALAMVVLSALTVGALLSTGLVHPADILAGCGL
jgi:hypothetical protein